MPIYEYRCEQCEHEFEKLVRPGDDEPENCPECSEASVSRLISDTSFKLKGDGWYETDYARDDDESTEEAEVEDEGSDSEGDEDD